MEGFPFELGPKNLLSVFFVCQLDGLEKNEKLSKENKMIIQEYLRILIKEKLEINDKE